MKLYALIKVAGNPKVKRYWQMLKRLYGGTDSTMENLKKTKDFGIYHGTRKKYIDNIMKDGLKTSSPIERGTGVFFGSKDIARHYGKRKFLDSENIKGLKSVTSTNFGGAKKIITDIKNKESNLIDSEGALIRFKYPNELKKSENYPHPNTFKNFDIEKNRDVVKEMQGGSYHLQNKITNGRIEGTKFYRSFAPEKSDKIIKKYDPQDKNIAGFIDPYSVIGKAGRARYIVKENLVNKFLDRQDFNKLKYNGQIKNNGKNMKLDHYILGNKDRNEMSSAENILPNLITKANKGRF